MDLVIFEDRKDIQKRSVYNMEFTIIFARISAQSVEEKAIQNAALTAQDLAHLSPLLQVAVWR